MNRALLTTFYTLALLASVALAALATVALLHYLAKSFGPIVVRASPQGLPGPAETPRIAGSSEGSVGQLNMNVQRAQQMGMMDARCNGGFHGPWIYVAEDFHDALRDEPANGCSY